eukprot:scaffold13094_cov70-Phaeocystis_antarctica.AAC.16
MSALRQLSAVLHCPKLAQSVSPSAARRPEASDATKGKRCQGQEAARWQGQVSRRGQPPQQPKGLCRCLWHQGAGEERLPHAREAGAQVPHQPDRPLRRCRGALAFAPPLSTAPPSPRGPAVP